MGVLGSAHRHPEEMPFDPGLLAQVNGFCACLFSSIRGAFVTMGDGAGGSQTNEVDVLGSVSLVLYIRSQG